MFNPSGLQIPDLSYYQPGFLDGPVHAYRAERVEILHTDWIILSAGVKVRMLVVSAPAKTVLFSLS